MRRSDAELLTRVEGDAPMGRLWRRYWLPVLQSERVVADGPPVKVRILGEDYVAFRGSDGRVAIVDERCPHRGVSLALGRNEECGLRCILHGWKIGTSGKVVDAPNLPATAQLDRLSTNARPVAETNGVVWAWFGEAEAAPPLPPYGFVEAPAGHVGNVATVVNCNWLQLLETLWDPYHVATLHAPGMEISAKSGLTKRPSSTGLPQFEFSHTPYGFIYTTESHGKTIHVPQVLPAYSYHTLGPSPTDDYNVLAHVPIDDTHTLFWMFVVSRGEPLRDDGFGRKLLDIFPAKFGYSSSFTAANGWNQDRESMAARTSYSGIATGRGAFGVVMEDIATLESMGPIADRSREHLAPTDLMITHGREVLLAALHAVERGESPPGIGPEVRGIVPALQFALAAQ